MFIGKRIPVPYGVPPVLTLRLGILLRNSRLRALNPRRNHPQRAFHLIPFQNAADLFAWNNHPRYLPGQPSRDLPYRVSSPCFLRRKVMRIFFIDRVIRMYDGNIQFPGNPPRGKKCREFALRVHEIRSPFEQFPHIPSGKRQAEPRPRIDQPRGCRPHIIYIVLPAGPAVP